MSVIDLLVGLTILVGLVGILVPILPGIVLIAAAILVWAIATGTTEGWLVFALATVILAVGTVVKYLLPGRALKTAVPNNTLLVGAVFAVIGFFVIPVVGLLVGFPIGVYAAEHVRVGREQAWPSTKAALKAVGVSILIELIFALAATWVWVGGVVVT